MSTMKTALAVALAATMISTPAHARVDDVRTSTQCAPRAAAVKITNPGSYAAYRVIAVVHYRYTAGYTRTARRGFDLAGGATRTVTFDVEAHEALVEIQVDRIYGSSRETVYDGSRLVPDCRRRR